MAQERQIISPPVAQKYRKYLQMITDARYDLDTAYPAKVATNADFRKKTLAVLDAYQVQLCSGQKFQGKKALTQLRDELCQAATSDSDSESDTEKSPQQGDKSTTTTVQGALSRLQLGVGAQVRDNKIIQVSGSQVSFFPSSEEKQGDTLKQNKLTMACEDGKFEEVKRLLREGISPANPDTKGKLPLPAAVYGMNLKIIELLLKEQGSENTLTWDMCKEHNQKHYGCIFITFLLTKLDSLQKWQQWLHDIKNNEYVIGKHCEIVTEAAIAVHAKCGMQWDDMWMSTFLQEKGTLYGGDTLARFQSDISQNTVFVDGYLYRRYKETWPKLENYEHMTWNYDDQMRQRREAPKLLEAGIKRHKEKMFKNQELPAQAVKRVMKHLNTECAQPIEQLVQQSQSLISVNSLSSNR